MDQHLCIVFRFPFNKIGTIYSTSIYIKEWGQIKNKNETEGDELLKCTNIDNNSTNPNPNPELAIVCVYFVCDIVWSKDASNIWFALILFSSYFSNCDWCGYVYRCVLSLCHCRMCFVFCVCVRCGACDVNVWLCLFDLHKVYVYGCITNKGKIF